MFQYFLLVFSPLHSPDTNHHNCNCWTIYSQGNESKTSE